MLRRPAPPRLADHSDFAGALARSPGPCSFVSARSAAFYDSGLFFSCTGCVCARRRRARPCQPARSAPAAACSRSMPQMRRRSDHAPRRAAARTNRGIPSSGDDLEIHGVPSVLAGAERRSAATGGWQSRSRQSPRKHARAAPPGPALRSSGSGRPAGRRSRRRISGWWLCRGRTRRPARRAMFGRPRTPSYYCVLQRVTSADQAVISLSSSGRNADKLVRGGRG